MDGRGECCIARYAAGGTYDMSKVDRILLRFRPIAPKPAAGGTVSGSSAAEKNEVYVRSGRGKRRYVRDGNSSSKRSSNRKRKSSWEETETDPLHKTTSGGGSVSGGETVVTLPLLPETPDRKDSPARGSPSNHSDLSIAEKQAQNEPIWLNFGNNDNNKASPPSSNGRQQVVSLGLDQTVVAMPQPVRLMGSIVTVECVTDTWVDGYGLGSTNAERMRNLERDTCPGFISDGLNRVGWTNGAYREMVDQDGVRVGGVMVWLVMKERVPITCPAFTCQVRVQYTCGNKERNSLTVPCDVWKMDGGDYAWRLDVKAALSLGR